MFKQRIERVRALIKEEVSRIIQFDLRDPRIRMVTVTDAEVSVDLRHAKIFFTVLGDEADRRACIAGLNHARKYIRGALAGNVRLKYIPDLTFEFDHSVLRAMRIEELLASIRSDSRAGSEGQPHEERPCDNKERNGD